MTHDEDALLGLIHARERPLGGLSVRRLLPSARRKTVGPWIFLDHMGPADFVPGSGVDVRPHPHIGLATVTYLFEGELLHRDSLGHTQAIRPGDINLMVAGRGITHSERERAEVRAMPHRLHGLQLWLALPEAEEDCAPAFHHYPDAQLPRIDVDGVAVRVLMGSAWGARSPVPGYAGALYAEAHLRPGQRLRLPPAPELALYNASGPLQIGDKLLPEHSLALLDGAAGALVQAHGAARIALIGGEPIGRRFIDWNFVASTQERIAQAKEDWRAGRFPKVVGDEEEFIPLAE